MREICEEFAMLDYDEDRTLLPLRNSRLTTPLGYTVSNKDNTYFLPNFSTYFPILTISVPYSMF